MTLLIRKITVGTQPKLFTKPVSQSFRNNGHETCDPFSHAEISGKVS